MPALLALAFLCVFVVGLVPAQSQRATTTLYLDTTAANAGETATTQLVLFLAPGQSLESFEIALSYSPAHLSLESTRLAPGWSARSDEGSSPPALVRLTARNDSAICAGGSSCLLATLTWRTSAVGNSTIAVEFAQLLDESGTTLAFDTAAGSVDVVQQSPPPANQGAPTGDNSAPGLGSQDAAVALAVVLLAGLALSAPVIAWALRRRQRATPDTQTSSPGRGPLAQDLAGAVADYLTTFEAAGQINTPVDPVYEQVARQAKGSPTLNETIRSGRSAATMLPRGPRPVRED